MFSQWTHFKYNLFLPFEVSAETEVIPKQQYDSPIYKDAEIEVRFCSDVLAVKVLDQAETELKDFHQDPVVLGFPIYPVNKMTV